MSTKTKIALSVAIVLGAASAALANEPTGPDGGGYRAWPRTQPDDGHGYAAWPRTQPEDGYGYAAWPQTHPDDAYGYAPSHHRASHAR